MPQDPKNWWDTPDVGTSVATTLPPDQTPNVENTLGMKPPPPSGPSPLVNSVKVWAQTLVNGLVQSAQMVNHVAQGDAPAVYQDMKNLVMAQVDQFNKGLDSWHQA